MGHLELPEEGSAVAKEDIPGSPDLTTSWTSGRQAKQTAKDERHREETTGALDQHPGHLEEAVGIKGAEPGGPAGFDNLDQGPLGEPSNSSQRGS